MWMTVALHGVAILAVGAFILWLSTFWLDLWTHHGDSISVPNVKGQYFDEAKALLEDEGFDVVLHDSVYENGVKPGAVVDQNPKDATNVKPGRTVYLTINAFYPRTVLVPVLTDMSVRQARTILEGLGIKDVVIKEVPSEYKDLVYLASWNGRRMTPGMRVPLTARIVLEVGSGYTEESFITDSVTSVDPGEGTEMDGQTAPEVHTIMPEPSDPTPSAEPDYFD